MMKKSEKKSRRGPSPKLPNPQTQLTERLMNYLSADSLKEYSEKTGIDYAQLRRYLKGEQEPGIEVFSKIIEAIGPEAINDAGFILTGKSPADNMTGEEDKAIDSSEVNAALEVLGLLISEFADLQRRVLQKPELAARVLAPLSELAKHSSQVRSAS